ncbi:MAG: hypothetical protein WCO10_01505 [bacterium]
MSKFEPVLVRPGDEVKDIITGFRGIVVFRAEHLLGCVRVGVQTPLAGDLKVEDSTQTFDEAQLLVCTRGKVSSPAKPLAVPDGAKLGDRAKDVVSGQEGVVVAISERIGGLLYASVQPEDLKGGKPKESFVTELQTLKVLKRSVVEADKLLGRQTKVEPKEAPPKKYGPRPDMSRLPKVG